MINLRTLLADPCAAWPYTQATAFNASEEWSWGQLCARICAWEQLLAPVPAPLVALYQRDSLEFFAALLALWRLGKQALVPANNLPATLVQLAELTPCFAGDFPLPECLTPSSDVCGELLPIAPPAPMQPALVLFTSGSSGMPVAVAKCFAQLEAELGALQTQWGESLAGAKVAASVSHHHIYGLLFRLLWPACSGRAFSRFEWDYWEELASLAAHHAPLAVISSPAHLRRIAPLTWPAAPFAAVFSSGAPLSQAESQAAYSALGSAVTEVYGSTETGGIGWRQQQKSVLWQCLPGVSVRLQPAEAFECEAFEYEASEGEAALLQVRSPHLPNSDWFSLADTASLDDTGRFNLCGRADRIAKVGGKRISLSAIERLLAQQPAVAQARVVLLPERGERLGAVLVLSDEGNRALIDQGKLAMNEMLRQPLVRAFDRVAIPRYWRYLAELPYNRQGKTTQAELQAVFSRNDKPRLPELISHTPEGNVLQLQFFVPSNLFYFNGHFPGRPVLPGVVQTHWAVHYAREHWGDLGEFSGLEALKFQQIIGANQRLGLRLEYQREKHKLYFAYTSGSDAAPVAHASGRIVFAAGAAS